VFPPFRQSTGLKGWTEQRVTGGDKVFIPVPGQKFTFGVVKAAQARGNFQVLADRGHKALRVHLNDVESGLKTLQNAETEALG
jgi:transaldolase / glucose-6-phosphate isomerase